MTGVIERQRKPLLRIVAALFSLVGIIDGKTVGYLSLPIYRKVLRLLRPAESAVRRLIVVAARGLTLKPPIKRAIPRKPAVARKPATRITFRLFDPRARFSSAFAWERPRYRIIPLARKPGPRVRVLDVGFDPRIPLFRQLPPVPPEVPSPPPIPDGSISAARLCRRLAAIKSALEDLPRQARRYARWLAKPQDERRPPFESALRRGSPPGFRKTPVHKVDEILAECDWLARQPPTTDTS